jgi:hypothetical protein
MGCAQLGWVKASLVVQGLQVHGLRVVVAPGGEGIIACPLARAAVHLDLHPADLGTERARVTASDTDPTARPGGAACWRAQLHTSRRLP